MTQSRQRGDAAPLPDEPALCYPSRPDQTCYSCARHRFGDPVPVSRRSVPVVDASLVRFQGECGLFQLRFVPVRAIVRQGTALEQAWRATA